MVEQAHTIKLRDRVQQGKEMLAAVLVLLTAAAVAVGAQARRAAHHTAQVLEVTAVRAAAVRAVAVLKALLPEGILALAEQLIQAAVVVAVRITAQVLNLLVAQAVQV